MTATAHALGTTGFRAPEVTMNKDYNQSVDIFSAGVCLFYMLTGEEPFSKVFKSKDGSDTKSDRYSLLLSNMKQYWFKYVGYKIIVSQSAKQLILRMLAFDPKDRILIKKIMQHEWYLGKYLSNGEQLKHHVISLLKQKLYFKGLEFKSPSITLTPLCIDETNKNLLFTIKSPKETQIIFDTLQNCVEKKLNGRVDYDDNNDHVLLCYVPDTENDEIVEFAASLYLSRNWNSKKALKSLRDAVKKNNDKKNNDNHNMDVELKSNNDSYGHVYTLMIREIDARDSKLIKFKDTIIKALEIVECKFLADIQMMKKWKQLVKNTNNSQHEVSKCIQL